jgi:uncharacterized protein YndB with AHSA1/START domain
MPTSRFEISFNAPIERVWERLVDHEGYARYPGVRSARLLERGKDHPGGLGALREMKVGGTTFIERIVEFEPHTCLAYKIIESRPIRIEHDIGRMQLTARGERTDLVWVTTGTIGVPLVGDALGWLMSVSARPTFWRFLRAMKADLESRERGAPTSR